MMKDERVVHENGNIPKSAILALGTCLKTLLLAPNVGDRFKRTIVSLVARAVDELPRNGARSAFRRVLVKSIAQGGVGMSATDYEYVQALRRAFGDIDHVLRERLDDLTNALATSG